MNKDIIDLEPARRCRQKAVLLRDQGNQEDLWRCPATGWAYHFEDIQSATEGWSSWGQDFEQGKPTSSRAHVRKTKAGWKGWNFKSRLIPISTKSDISWTFRLMRVVSWKWRCNQCEVFGGCIHLYPPMPIFTYYRRRPCGKPTFFGVSSVSTRFTIQLPRHAMPAQYHGPGTAVRGAAESPRLVPDTSNTRPSDGVKVRSWGAPCCIRW